MKAHKKVKLAKPIQIYQLYSQLDNQLYNRFYIQLRIQIYNRVYYELGNHLYNENKLAKL